MAEGGLRERKKAKTRALIVEAATPMFIERAFDDVTLDEVAAACEVSVRTVLRHFETKEALALSEEIDALERFKAGLARRSGGVLSYWRYYVGMISAEFAAREDWHRSRFAILREPAVRAEYVRIQREIQRLLAAALAEESSGDPFAPEMLAASLSAGNEAVMADWLRDSRPFEPHALLEVIDYACDIFADRLKPTS
ncbi:MAG TPA: TetR family transcriptional regulator [Acidimicrobiales bacterium]|nr:TetR family transcriptional regulator [Acidimicrobiales bacterium]